MPTIEVHANGSTFADPHQPAADLASTLMEVEQVPNLPMFRGNTAAFVHALPVGAISNVEGAGGYVRVQGPTNFGALDRDKQLAVVSRFTDLVATAAAEPELRDRTWVVLTEAVDGGWGLWGHAHTNAELVAAARAEAATLSSGAEG